MKIKIIIAFVAIVGALGLVGCKPKPVALTGQIFIVTRGAENIKLGLVEVQLIQRQDVKSFLDKIMPTVETEISSRQHEFESAKSAFEKSTIALAAFDSSGPLTTTEYKQMLTDSDALTNEYARLSDRYAEFEKHNRNSAANLAAEVDAAYLAATNCYAEKLNLVKFYDEKSDAVFKAEMEMINATGNYMRKYYLGEMDRAEKMAGDIRTAITNKSAEIHRLVEIANAKKAAIDLLNEDLSREKNKLADFSQEMHSGTLRLKLDYIEKNSALQRADLEHRILEAQSRQEKAKLHLAAYPSAESYFSNFPLPTVQKTLTDADGKFFITYPRVSALAIFAKAERVLGTKTEKYFWLVNAPTNSETAQIFLSNQNLIYVDPDGYFQIKPKQVHWEQ
jgi:hypothetical protein